MARTSAAAANADLQTGARPRASIDEWLAGVVPKCAEALAVAAQIGGALRLAGEPLVKRRTRQRPGLQICVGRGGRR